MSAVTVDDDPSRCPACGRDYATAARALTCPCGAGLAAMQQAALTVLDTVQRGVGRLADGLEVIADRVAGDSGTPTLEQLAASLAAHQVALDDIALRELEDQLGGLDVEGLT